MRNIKELVEKMTLEEKASMCSGETFWDTQTIERLGIPSVMVSDGPHGLRKQEGGKETEDQLGNRLNPITSICFPAACATASSFDTDLIEQMGETLGEECQATDVSVLLGPAINIKRSPLCGRNFEYFSEDPYLTGKISAAHIRGVQSWNVGTSLKHFACNNQEYLRMSVDSIIDERTLREIYLAGFEIAVKESQPKTIMCSYNRINGVYSAENKKLLSDILRDEWGFKGYVMTDWGAVADRVKGIAAGLDLEMPTSHGANDAKIVEAVKNGTLDEKLLDKAVTNLLNVIFDYVDNKSKHTDAKFDRERDHKKAVEVESECAVLLKNNGVLPLNKEKKIAYIGEFAEKPRYQGGGSSHIKSWKVISALEAAKNKGRKIEYSKGFPFNKDELNQSDFNAAVECAKNADVAVVFAGLPDALESEGFDRKNLDLPECQNKLIEEICRVNKNVVVVLHNGAPVILPWRDNVSAILELYLGGEGVGEACDRLLYGETNPCGKLPETFPVKLEDTPCYENFGGNGWTTEYKEGVYVGYRYYDKKKMAVQYPFGFGLSYTTFEFSNLKLSSSKMDDSSKITVSVDVKNTGCMRGKEVVQLYIADKTGTFGRPIKELKGFKKVQLDPQEFKTIELEIDARSLSWYSQDLGDWFAKSGKYEILVGNSSDNILAKAEINFTTKKHLPIKIGPDTTMGLLIEDERTAPIVDALFNKNGNPWEEGADIGELGEGSAEMANAMFTGLPIKSIASFGIATREEVDKFIEDLKKAVE